MIEFEEYKGKLNGLKPTLDSLREALHLESAEKEIEELEGQSARDGFWNDVEKSQRVQKRLKQLKSKVENYQKLCSGWDDLMTLCEMAIEEDDDSMLPELQSEYAEFEKKLEETRLGTLLTGEYDANNAILTFHAGAGGTEAQDWTQMLYRMYNMWADRHGYTVKLMDYLDGDEAGIKSATILIEGENAYGFLKSEHGIHRLVRISPFDSSGRRHTSFASVDLLPDAGDEISIEIRDADLRIDVYRASGAGGQHVNKTESAVRITHLPTGIVAQCQNEKSQHSNRESAMRILRARLYEHERSKRDAARQADYAGKDAIAFGSQIRTYTLQPYRLVKDHRTGSEMGDVDAVLDGRISQFLRDYLLYRHERQPRP